MVCGLLPIWRRSSGNVIFPTATDAVGPIHQDRTLDTFLFLGLGSCLAVRTPVGALSAWFRPSKLEVRNLPSMRLLMSDATS
jgi:hypothetical protein